MKKLLFISISLSITILTGCNNVDTILSNYNNIFFKNNEKIEQIKDEKVRDVINYCDVLYSNEEEQYFFERNIYLVFINANNELRVMSSTLSYKIYDKGNLMDISQLKEGVKAFINNNGRNPNSSDSPEKAIFLIHSEGHSGQDDKIIELINSAYNSLNIPINERKICYMSGSILEEWRSVFLYIPPPPPPPPPEIIEIVEDEVEIENELEVEDTDTDENDFVEQEEEEGSDEVFSIVEQMPIFPGGDLGVMKFIQKTVKYPPIAKENDITGKVYVSYVVNKKGKVTNVKVVRSVDKYLDAEAARVVKLLSYTTAGKQRGKPVNVQYTIPINFTLN